MSILNQLPFGTGASLRGYVALGSNQSDHQRSARNIVSEAMQAMPDSELNVTSLSKLYVSPAFPPGAGADFVNAVVEIETALRPEKLIEKLHQIERRFGRVRRTRWAARTLDLDLLSLGDLVLPDPGAFDEWASMPLSEQIRRTPETLILPHPRLQDRPFVLKPLEEIAPDWRHPVTGHSVAALLDALPPTSRDAVIALD